MRHLKRGRNEADTYGVQAALSACKGRRQGFDPYLSDREDLGQLLGKRYGIPACSYGHSSEKAGKGLFYALFIFVAIPLPGTGAWTGTLAASFLDMGFKKSVIAVMLGVIIAGVIMALASMGLFGGLSAIFAPH